MIKASVIIRAYNEEKHLGNVLERVKNQEFDSRGLEIIVVDSGSKDKTVEVAKTRADKVLHIAPEDFTFGHALNAGIEASSGEYSVFLSAHCYPASDQWLRNLLAPFKNERITCVYGKQRGVESSIFSEIQIFRSWFPEESVEIQKHPFCNNANAAIRRAAWERNRYDETLTGLEDLDWAKRNLSNGNGCLSYAAEAEVEHVHDETTRGIYNRYKREGIAYSRIFPNQRFSFLHLMSLLSSNVISDYRTALENGIFIKNLLSIPRFRFLQFSGTYMGRNFHNEVDRQLMERFYYPRKPFRK